MAVVTANANIALDMGTLQIGDWYGSTTTANSSHIAYNPSSGEYADFYGSFYYDGGGTLYDGWVEQIELSYQGTIDFRITGLDLDAPTFFEWVYYNETDEAFSVMFGGADTFYGSNLGDWLEGFAGNDTLYGYGGNDDLYGGSGNDYIDGGAGSDYMYGGQGNDVFVITSSGDRVFENSGEGYDLIYSELSLSLEGSFVEDLTLTGSANTTATGSSFDNILTGNAGDNVIDGRGGADKMVGGLGHDVYIVDNTGDLVVENSNQGFDLVKSSVSYALSAYVEDLTLTGSANLNGTGNGFDNILTGNSGNNVLDGGTGADKMIGGLGNDVFVVDNANDLVVENSGEGFDLVKSSISYTLGVYVEDLTLTGSANVNGTGNSFDNILTGNGGNNVLDGGTGADKMTGGLGNDVFIVDNANDLVIENSNQGFDLVKSSVSYALGAYVEDLTLTGSAAINGAGNSFDNILTGNGANNTLDGKSGADKMIGGLGNDIYIVDDRNDLTVELSNQGFDLVKSSVSYTLNAYVEDLTLTGTAAINGAGNSFDNILNGNSANNTLDGKAGADKMVGGKGNDTYIVDNRDDLVVEGSGSGTDTVKSGVSYTMVANLENLTLTGTEKIHAAGNSLANIIIGNTAGNTIRGNGGADTLTGGRGADVFDFDAIGDSTTSAFDRITDLTNDDRIDLSTIDARTDTSGNNAFVLADSFTGRSGQMTIDYDAGTNLTTLLMDVNGDRVADMKIVISGDHDDFTNFIF